MPIWTSGLDLSPRSRRTPAATSSWTPSSRRLALSRAAHVRGGRLHRRLRCQRLRPSPRAPSGWSFR
eukprot:7109921-Alexandrium_andersonii.AAC.1